MAKNKAFRGIKFFVHFFESNSDRFCLLLPEDSREQSLDPFRIFWCSSSVHWIKSHLLSPFDVIFNVLLTDFYVRNRNCQNMFLKFIQKVFTVYVLHKCPKSWYYRFSKLRFLLLNVKKVFKKDFSFYFFVGF